MSKTLLVVDDSATICHAVRHALTGEEWTVLTASNEGDALELLRSRSPDAVLCDVSLGDANGYEVCRSIRAASRGNGPAVVLMGAKVSESGAKSVGASGTLPKPFESSELLGTLEAALDKSEFDIPLGSLEDDSEILSLETGSPERYRQSAEASREVDIIDLSGDEEFAELELLEGLAPLDEPTPRRPPAHAGQPLSASDDFGLLRTSAEFVELGAGDEPRPLEDLDLDSGLDLEELTGPAKSRGQGPTEPLDLFTERTSGGADDLFDFEAEEPPRDLAGARGIETSLSGSYGSPPETRAADAPEPAESAEDRFSFDSLEFDKRLEAAAPDTPHGPAGTPQTPTRATEPVSRAKAPGAEPAPPAGEAIETALREALEQRLSAEKLSPMVEAVVERIAWDVVPVLAERLIREAIEKLRGENPPSEPV